MPGMDVLLNSVPGRWRWTGALAADMSIHSASLARSLNTSICTSPYNTGAEELSFVRGYSSEKTTHGGSEIDGISLAKSKLSSVVRHGPRTFRFQDAAAPMTNDKSKKVC